MFRQRVLKQAKDCQHQHRQPRGISLQPAPPRTRGSSEFCDGAFFFMRVISFLHTGIADTGGMPFPKTMGTCFWEKSYHTLRKHRKCFFRALALRMPHCVVSTCRRGNTGNAYAGSYHAANSTVTSLPATTYGECGCDVSGPPTSVSRGPWQRTSPFSSRPSFFRTSRSVFTACSASSFSQQEQHQEHERFRLKMPFTLQADRSTAPLTHLNPSQGNIPLHSLDVTRI